MQINDTEEGESQRRFSESEFHSAEEIEDDSDEEKSSGRSEKFKAVYQPMDRELIDRLKESFPEFPDDKIFRFMVARKFDYVRPFFIFPSFFLSFTHCSILLLEFS